MLGRKTAYVLAVAAIVALGFFTQAICQEAQPKDRGPQDGDQMRQRMEQYRQQAAQRMKQDLGASDEEWQVIQPRLDKVSTLSRDLRAGGTMFGRDGRSGRGPGGDRGPGDNRPPGGSDRPQSDVQQKQAELQKVVQNKDATADQINAALAAYRQARAKAKADLEKAQKELQEVLTVRQEALLVSRGTLE